MSTTPIVFDTNIIVSALLSKEGSPAKIYRIFLTGALTLIYSPQILEEYQDVLYRPYLQIPHADVDIVINAIRQYGKEVWVMPQSVGIMPDEDDRVFYDAAKSTGAYLITGNTKHYPCEPFILTPSEFLNLRLDFTSSP